MAIIAEVKEKMKKAMKSGNDSMRTATRMVMGEVPRLNKLAGEEPTDEEMVKIIRGLVKSELLTLSYSGRDSSDYVECLESLLPPMVNSADILDYIRTVDVTKLKNKMQLIGLVKNHFGAQNVDSAEVKRIVESM